MSEQNRSLPEWLDTEQLAEYIATPVNTLLSWRKKPDGPGPRYYKLGRRVRYRRSEVDSWLASRAIGDAPAPAKSA